MGCLRVVRSADGADDIEKAGGGRSRGQEGERPSGVCVSGRSWLICPRASLSSVATCDSPVSLAAQDPLSCERHRTRSPRARTPPRAGPVVERRRISPLGPVRRPQTSHPADTRSLHRMWRCGPTVSTVSECEKPQSAAVSHAAVVHSRAHLFIHPSTSSVPHPRARSSRPHPSIATDALPRLPVRACGQPTDLCLLHSHLLSLQTKGRCELSSAVARSNVCSSHLRVLTTGRLRERIAPTCCLHFRGQSLTFVAPERVASSRVHELLEDSPVPMPGCREKTWSGAPAGSWQARQLGLAADCAL